MADRSDASIRIGGKLPRNLLDALLDEISGENAAIEWTDEPIEDVEDLQDSIIPGEPLEVVASQKVGGLLESLEAFCRANALTYVRHSDPHYTYDGSLAWWKPGMERPGEAPTGIDGEPMIEVSFVRAALAKLDLEADSPAAELETLLDLYTPCEVPPFEIAD
jgi:hypothetical protein